MANSIYTAALKLVTPGSSGHSYQLISTQETVIGREVGCQIVLDSQQHPGVSRRHAAIRPLVAQQTFEVCDLNSGNGTFVNGQRVQSAQPLQAGDRISLGLNGATFVFELVATRPTVEEPDSALTMSSIFPLLSSRKDLRQKAYLVPGIVTVIFVAILFSASNPILYILAVAFYIALAAFYFVYQLCGKRKPVWELIGAAVLELLFLITPVFSIAAFVFRGLLPGQIPTPGSSAGLLSTFISYFFGAGLLEELIKALPVFLFLWLGQVRRSSRIGVREPLDGILLGVASATAFTLLETLGQYVPSVIAQVGSQFGQGAGYFVGLQLLIPRVLGSIAGHMAYSGYFGYFIGLAMLKPRKRWRLLGIGYLTSSLLHALWNTFAGFSDILLVVIGVASYAFLVAAILKARALSPTRAENFATRFH